MDIMSATTNSRAAARFAIFFIARSSFLRYSCTSCVRLSKYIPDLSDSWCPEWDTLPSPGHPCQKHNKAALSLNPTPPEKIKA